MIRCPSCGATEPAPPRHPWRMRCTRCGARQDVVGIEVGQGVSRSMIVLDGYSTPPPPPGTGIVDRSDGDRLRDVQHGELREIRWGLIAAVLLAVITPCLLIPWAAQVVFLATLLLLWPAARWQARSQYVEVALTVDTLSVRRRWFTRAWPLSDIIGIEIETTTNGVFESHALFIRARDRRGGLVIPNLPYEHVEWLASHLHSGLLVAATRGTSLERRGHCAGDAPAR